MKTQTESKATPRPWKLSSRDNEAEMFHIHGYEKGYKKIAEVFEESDASLVLRAVNSHEALLGAANNILQYLADIHSDEIPPAVRLKNALALAEGK